MKGPAMACPQALGVEQHWVMAVIAVGNISTQKRLHGSSSTGQEGPPSASKPGV